MRIYDFIKPCEQNDYCLFDKELEQNPNIVFHTAPKENFESILEKGFLSAQELGVGGNIALPSVSYAKHSSGCVSHRGITQDEDYVVFAVKFQNIQDQRIVDSGDVIYVYIKELQPKIIAYMTIPKEFQLR